MYSMQCAFDLWLPTCLLVKYPVRVYSPKWYTLVLKYVLFILHIFRKVCLRVYMYIYKQTHFEGTGTHKPELCKSQINLFNKTLTSQWKHPKFAGMMSEWWTTSAKEPNEKPCSGHLEPDIPEQCTCTGPKYWHVGPSALPSPKEIVIVEWVADRWVSQGVNSEYCGLPIMYRQSPRPL